MLDYKFIIDIIVIECENKSAGYLIEIPEYYQTIGCFVMLSCGHSQVSVSTITFYGRWVSQFQAITNFSLILKVLISNHSQYEEFVAWLDVEMSLIEPNHFSVSVDDRFSLHGTWTKSPLSFVIFVVEAYDCKSMNEKQINSNECSTIKIQNLQ